MARFLVVPFAVLLGLLAIGAAPPAPEVYPARAAELAPETRAICEQVAQRRPPASDWPSRAESRSLKPCSSSAIQFSSEALYYGVGRRADPVQARKCALLEWRTAGSDPVAFYGGDMLVTIYANGRGARRDLDLAIHLQCSLSTAPVDTNTLVKALAARRKKGDRSYFNYCLEVEQGLSNNSIVDCYAHGSRMREPARAAKLRTFAARLPAGAKAAYARLKVREAAFIAARIEGEHRGGVINRTQPIAFSDEVMDADVLTLQQIARGRAPKATPEARATAERRLHAEYRKFLNALSEPDSLDDLKPAGLAHSQASWAAYRDGWLELVRAAWPKLSVDGIAKRLADQRTDMLRCLALDNAGEDAELEKLCG